MGQAPELQASPRILRCTLGMDTVLVQILPVLRSSAEEVTFRYWPFCPSYVSKKGLGGLCPTLSVSLLFQSLSSGTQLFFESQSQFGTSWFHSKVWGTTIDKGTCVSFTVDSTSRHTSVGSLLHVAFSVGALGTACLPA